jgi:hypothetical protein
VQAPVGRKTCIGVISLFEGFQADRHTNRGLGELKCKYPTIPRGVALNGGTAPPGNQTVKDTQALGVTPMRYTRLNVINP